MVDGHTDAKPASDQRQNSPFAEISPSPAPAPPASPRRTEFVGSIHRWTMFFTAAAQRSQPQLSNSLPIGTTCRSAKSSNMWCESCRLSRTMIVVSVFDRFGGRCMVGALSFSSILKIGPIPAPGTPGFNWAPYPGAPGARASVAGAQSNPTPA